MNMRTFQRFGATAIALLMLKSVHAATGGVTDPALIRAAAERAVREAAGAGTSGLVIATDAIDPRVRLADCPVPLTATIAGDGQLREHVVVGVRCAAGVQWVVYTGVALATDMPVLVARRALPLGAEPQAADFEAIQRRVPGLFSGYVSNASQLVGQRLRRALASGEALDSNALLTNPIVRRGQELTLLAHADGVDIRVLVVALADGKPQERIRVQNPVSQRVLEATVRSPQLVELSL